MLSSPSDPPAWYTIHGSPGLTRLPRAVDGDGSLGATAPEAAADGDASPGGSATGFTALEGSTREAHPNRRTASPTSRTILILVT